MKTEKELLKMALDALEFKGNIWHMDCKKDDAIIAIKDYFANHIPDAKEMVEKKPTTEKLGFRGLSFEKSLAAFSGKQDAPQKRAWVGLDEEELDEEASREEQSHGFIQGALWAEESLKGKNT